MYPRYELAEKRSEIAERERRATAYLVSKADEKRRNRDSTIAWAMIAAALGIVAYKLTTGIINIILGG